MGSLQEGKAIAAAITTGIGIDENRLVSLGKWTSKDMPLFRSETQFFSKDDTYNFEKWKDGLFKHLKREFLRFENALVQWSMHPWERDARLANEALSQQRQSYDVLVEVACARSSEELLGARKAYHSIFNLSLEEDVAFRTSGGQRKLLVALVSSYRYEGQKTNSAIAKEEAAKLRTAIENGDKIKSKAIEDEELVRILSTRSKLHLKATFDHYKETHKKNFDEDIGTDPILKATVQCLSTPPTYFSNVLDEALKDNADEKAKQALTRVIVTRAETDMKGIKEEYQKKTNASLSDKIGEKTRGNYKEFLLNLVAIGDESK
ncbi:annexin D4-like [Malania oleifera]|uniref:annexin D4-like n=1 Tax=Malania oleifera TaxID=397392 RepID=UPI0025AE597B|nr:annexin D4-like [Malania oleifera]